MKKSKKKVNELSTNFKNIDKLPLIKYEERKK
jgi:hypothetical protein